MEDAILQAQYAIGASSQSQVVGTDNECLLKGFIQADQLLVHRFSRSRIEIARRLIQQDETRAIHQSTYNGHALPFPPG